MALTAQAMLGDKEVTVRELTVAEVREWVAERESGLAPLEPLRAMVFDDCTLDDLARMCDLPVEAMELAPPSELEELRDKCKAVNPYFFKVRAALTGVAQALMAAADSLGSTPTSSQ